MDFQYNCYKIAEFIDYPNDDGQTYTKQRCGNQCFKQHFQSHTKEYLKYIIVNLNTNVKNSVTINLFGCLNELAIITAGIINISR